MKNLILIIALFAFASANAQSRWSSTFGTGSARPLAVPGNQPLNSKEWFVDTSRSAGHPLDTWRPFVSYNEAANWLTTGQRFMGTQAFIDSTGTLSNGLVTGGTLLCYVYNANSQLVFDHVVGAGNNGVGPWTVSGNNIYNNNSGNVGIGTNAPMAKLDIDGIGRFRKGLTVSSVVGSGGFSVYNQAGNDALIVDGLTGNVSASVMISTPSIVAGAVRVPAMAAAANLDSALGVAVDGRLIKYLKGKSLTDGNKVDITVINNGAGFIINTEVVDSTKLAPNAVTGVKVLNGSLPITKLAPPSNNGLGLLRYNGTSYVFDNREFALKGPDVIPGIGTLIEINSAGQVVGVGTATTDQITQGVTNKFFSSTNYRNATKSTGQVIALLDGDSVRLDLNINGEILGLDFLPRTPNRIVNINQLDSVSAQLRTEIAAAPIPGLNAVTGVDSITTHKVTVKNLRITAIAGSGNEDRELWVSAFGDIGVRAKSGAGYVNNINRTPSISGSLLTFPSAYTPNRLAVYHNGLRLIRNVHYTETDAAAGTITLLFTPAYPATIVADY